MELEQIVRDTTVQDSAGAGGIVNRRWRHDGYDVVSHYDSTHKANTLALRDRRGREWRLGLIGSSYVQIFWLDKPGDAIKAAPSATPARITE